MIRQFGRERKVEVWLYDECRYTTEKGHVQEVYYSGCVGFDVKTMLPDEVEQQGMIDDYNEYLVLYFSDGSEATFRNSYVDLFI